MAANFSLCQDLGQRIGQIWDFCSLYFLLCAVSTRPVLLGWSLYRIEPLWNVNLTHCVAMGGGTISPSQCCGFKGWQLLFWSCHFCRYALYILYTWNRRQLSDIPKILNSNCLPAVFIFMHLHIAFYLLISIVIFLKEKDSLLSFSKEPLLRRMLLLWTLREALKERGSLFEKQKHRRNMS